jgi:hypothetical protein
MQLVLIPGPWIMLNLSQWQYTMVSLIESQGDKDFRRRYVDLGSVIVDCGDINTITRGGVIPSG